MGEKIILVGIHYKKEGLTLLELKGRMCFGTTVVYFGSVSSLVEWLNHFARMRKTLFQITAGSKLRKWLSACIQSPIT